MESKPTDPLVGTERENRYFESVIGEGSTSVIYKALHKIVHRTVAIKVLRPEIMVDVAAMRRIQHEALVMSSLNAPNVVSILDFGIFSDGRPFITMEYLAGDTLQQRLRKDKMEPPEVRELFRDICYGLDAIHSRGVIHRALDPSEVILAEAPKIIDFGYARQDKPTKDGLVQSSTGVPPVNPAYTSPEVLNEEKDDQRSDIYSLCCMMYEALAGKPPYIGQSYIEIAQQQCSTELASTLECADSGLSAIVTKGLNKNPNDRWQSAAELAKALDPSRETASKKPSFFGALFGKK